MAYVDENLNDPTLFFETLIYTGDGSSPRSISGLDFQPDLVWGHRRDDAAGHNLFDSVRTAGSDKNLQTNGNGAEGGGLPGTYGYLSAFTSDGFTTTQGSNTDGGAYWNINTATYTTWNWKESATAGFDIVAYTGNAVDGRTIAHSLSAVPDMYIVKNRSATEPWMVYHGTLGNTNAMYLNTTMASTASNGYTNDTSPTSSVFSVSDWEGNNGDGNSLIAYLFTAKQGFSKFGSYVGNGDADGTFVYTGFRPAFLMVKAISGTNGWPVYDNTRDTFNPVEDTFYSNTNEAEVDYTAYDFCANGFKNRSTGGSHNSSDVTYIYMAFAEAPFVNSNGVPCNAR